MSSAKETRTLDSRSGKRVILVIDEARSLLGEGENSLNHFRLLRQALKSAITTNEGVFGVLVDTNSKVSDLTPPLPLDPSSRRIEGEELASFSPFVLTHTMDVFWQKHCGEQDVRGEKMHDNDETVVDMQDKAVEAAGEMVDVNLSGSDESKRDDVADNNSKACGGKKEMSADETAYKDAVTGSEQDAWNALVRMGRPMWYSTFIKASNNHEAVICFAANKLLLGRSPVSSNYMAHNMFGVASLLCRVGLRPYSTSSFASRAVADFMSILAYVNYEKEGYVSSYASDPVLTLGAMKVWHSPNDALANFILPQLKKLILNEALDTGGIGEVVARIVLLLAMDECVVEIPSYVGQFISVRAFLKTFGVDKKMSVLTHGMSAATGDIKNAFRTWLSQWDGWRMGFTHFVQLKLQPTEETLWYLLGRRAAGIFPRNQKGADLLIPIFWKKTDGEAAFGSETQTEGAVDAKVSVILIQVKNRTSRDNGFPDSATTKLCPSYVFGGMLKKPEVPGQTMEGVEGPSIKKPVEDISIEELIENPLSKKSVRDVICIYMNVQEESSQHHRFVYANDENKSKDGSGSGGPKAHGKKPKTGNLEAESAATTSGLNDNKANAASKLMFSLCYRSVRGETYKFLDEKVAVRLVSLMQTLWDPMVLVAGDLKYRQEVEDRGEKHKAVLSQAMGDDELKTVACKGFADPPGLHKPVAKGQDDKSKKQRKKRRKRQRKR